MIKGNFNKLIDRISSNYYQHLINSGRKIFVKNSKFGFKVILDISYDVDRRFLLSSFETSNFEIMKKIIRKDWNIIDVGANIGLYSLLFARRTFGQVYAFEPSDEVYQRLKINVKLNSFNNIKINKKLVSDS